MGPVVAGAADGACRPAPALRCCGLPLLAKIRDGFCSDGEWLTTVELSDCETLTDLGKNSFRNCRSLRTVALRNLPQLAHTPSFPLLHPK